MRTVIEEQIRSSDPSPKLSKGMQDEGEAASRYWKLHGIIAVAQARETGRGSCDRVCHDGRTPA